MKTKILYLLHTDWAWIKQRSQFIAEELHGLGFDLNVVYKLSPRRATLVKNATQLRVHPLPFLPFKLRVRPALRRLDTLLWRLILEAYIKANGITHVIVTHPLLGDYVATTGAHLIYDCHDDNAEFYPPGPLKTLIEEQHHALLRRSKLNVFSSMHLEEKFRSSTASMVVRNGHTIDGTARAGQIKHYDAQSGNHDRFRLFYFGTISEWFDFNLILHLLERCENLHITIIGPTDVATATHPHMAFTGPMNHAELLAYAKNADAFIMPFSINPLIEGVDPVKLYEYLAYDVPVMSIFYEELRHFGHLIDFYNDPEQAVDLVRKYIRNRPLPVDKAARAEFLSGSTWKARAAQYAAAITAMPPVGDTSHTIQNDPAV